MAGAGMNRETIPMFYAGVVATFSADRTHRYSWRCNVGQPSLLDLRGWRALFVMLNPSTADELGPDPTVRRCIGFASSWGYQQLEIRNLFSLRSTDPRALYGADNPEGDPRNITDILNAAMAAAIVVCAWGVHGSLRGRGAAVAAALRAQGTRLHHLGLTKDGHPRHPLYLPKDLRPAAWDDETSRLPDLRLAERDPAEAPGREQLVVDHGHDEDELRADVDGEGAGGDGTDGGHGEQLHAPFIEATRPIVAGRGGDS